jgi:predicted metal-binding membrane protein
MAAPALPPPTLLESALRHDRLIVVTGLALVTTVSWGWILAMSTDMYGPMRGASTWAMTASWDLPHLLLLFAMWTVMMTAMMIPSAAPMLMLYIAVVRGSEGAALVRRAYALAGGYLTVWSLFSAAAAIGQGVLTQQSLVSPMMDLVNARVGAVLLIAVAVYQFTPLKRDCLDSCRSPLTLFTTHWRPGTGGAFRMGLRHGLYCLGCCWTLMLLLFVGGVMNAYVIAGLTLFVFIEKVTPIGRAASYVGGVVLAAIGLWLLVA